MAEITRGESMELSSGLNDAGQPSTMNLASLRKFVDLLKDFPPQATVLITQGGIYSSDPEPDRIIVTMSRAAS